MDVLSLAPPLWLPDAKSWLIGKDPDVGKDWRREEKWRIEDEMVGWHHQLNGHEFEQALGDCERQGSLVCCGSWGLKELDTTERLNNKCQQSQESAEGVVCREKPPGSPEAPQKTAGGSAGWFNPAGSGYFLITAGALDVPKLRLNSFSNWPL